MRGIDERLQVEPLPGQVLDAGQQHEREPRTLALDLADEVLVPQQLLAGPRRHLHEG